MFEYDYKNLLKQVIMNGEHKFNRTGVLTRSMFNKTLRIKMKRGFPIITGKKIFFDKAKLEYEWMMSGSTNVKKISSKGLKWWDEFADSNGDIGKSYGYQLRNFCNCFDQIEDVVNKIKNNSRRAYITFWNPTDFNESMLPPCYTGMNFVRYGNKLNASLNLRSSDLFLGLPYDICVVALIFIKISKETKLECDELCINIADAHVYENHIIGVAKYFSQKTYPLPIIDKDKLKLLNYNHSKFIKTPLNI